MDTKIELKKIKAEIESKQEEKEKYEKKLVQLRNREKEWFFVNSGGVKRL